MYRVKLKDAATGFVMDDVVVDTLGAAISLQNSWFKDFHAPRLPEFDIHPLVSHAVTTTITRVQELEHA